MRSDEDDRLVRGHWPRTPRVGMVWVAFDQIASLAMRVRTFDCVGKISSGQLESYRCHGKMQGRAAGMASLRRMMTIGKMPSDVGPQDRSTWLLARMGQPKTNIWMMTKFGCDWSRLIRQRRMPELFVRCSCPSCCSQASRIYTVSTHYSFRPTDHLLDTIPAVGRST
jgi:hypothetical protein